MNKKEMIEYLTKNYSHIFSKKEIEEIAIRHVKEESQKENERFECMVG